ncbi:hypothetical protein X975_15053, partial [Stegodyphus mimosarum]
MFSDESRFSLQSDSRRTFIWRAPGPNYLLNIITFQKVVHWSNWRMDSGTLIR